MLDENILKEKLSIAVIQSICAQAGYPVEITTVDTGLDGTIIDVVYDNINKFQPTGGELKFQAKSTHNIRTYPDYIAYDLRNKNYNILIQRRAMPMILILFVLPEDRRMWLNISEDYIKVCKCAYWVDLRNTGSVKNNLESTTTIHIPRTNILTPEVIENFLVQYRNRLKVIDNLEFDDGGEI